MPKITYEKEKVHMNLVKYKKGEDKFEIDVDPDKAIAFRNKQIDDISEVLMAKKIFTHAMKGFLAPEDRLEAVFGTKDPLEVAKQMVMKGEIQLTEKYREAQRELKVKQIVQIIHRNGVDPRTHLPHPAARLESAMEEAKVKIDYQKSAEDQVQDVLEKLRTILPIKFEIKEIAVKIPPQYAAKAYPMLKSMGKLLKDNWLSDGSLSAIVEVPGGLETDFYDKLNSFTHGNNEARVIKTR